MEMSYDIPITSLSLTQPSKYAGPNTNEEGQEPPMLPLSTTKYILEDQPINQRHYNDRT